MVYSDGTVSFVGDANLDIPERYEWALFKNGELVGLILGNNSFPIDIDPANDALTVRGINIMGGLGPETPVAGTADIHNLQSSMFNLQSSMFNLQGHKIASPKSTNRHSRKGLYIIDGRKVIQH